MKWLGRYTPYRLNKSESSVNADSHSMEKRYTMYDLDGEEIFVLILNDRNIFQDAGFFVGESDISKLTRYYGLKDSVMVLDKGEDSIFLDSSD